MTANEAKKRLYDTTPLIGALRRRAAIKVLAESPDTSAVVALGEALGNTHPDAKRIAKLLRQLKSQSDGTKIDKVHALWLAWATKPTAAMASVLADLGWPRGRAVEARTACHILAAATANATPEVLRAVSTFARVIPANDETLNDAIYGAWIRSQSETLETLIAEQGRQPGSLALEALHALVTGRLEGYGALGDADGTLLVQAFTIAPESFRARIAKTVAASPDRQHKDAYRRALSGVTADAATVENLMLVGDEDGLFEMTRSLRLADVLGLCERWAESGRRPSGAQQNAAVGRAVAAYRTLGQFKVEPAPPLPDGLVDIFDYWRSENRSDDELRSDLNAPDPFHKARGLYLGRERGLVDDDRLRVAATSEHWPERLIARLLEPSLLAETKEDHVFWVSACAGDASVLQTPIGGTPEDYARHTALLGAAAGRTRALLEIVCAFQSAFVASGIVVDESAEAIDRGAVEIEDAPRAEF